MKESRVIKRHACWMYKQNMGGLLRLSLLVALPELLLQALGLFPMLAELWIVWEGIRLLLSLAVFPLDLGAARMLLFTFENDRLEGSVWRYYRQGSRRTILVLWLISSVPMALVQLLQPILEMVQTENPPQWLLLLAGALCILFLAGFLWFACRFLLCQYLFFLDEGKPAKALVSQSLQRTAGYTGFILSFCIPLFLLYSLCSVAIPFILTMALPAGAAWWQLLSPILAIPVWPYIYLSVAGLASVLLPSEKERRQAGRKKLREEGKVSGK